MADKREEQQPSSEYRTLESESRGIIREKMSKFIAIAFPIDSAEDARQKISKIANEYHDARHVCWAYMAGASGNDFMSNDNGEPSGTAGRPILGQIRSAGLTNVAVAVVRYFGGIKLGTSGLITAYKEAAKAALEAGVVISRCEEDEVTLTFPYENMESVMRILKNSDARIISQDFDCDCRMTLRIRSDRKDELLKRLSNSVSVGDIGNL